MVCAQGGLSLQRRCQSHRGTGALGVQSFEVMDSLTVLGNLIDICGVVRLMTQGVRDDLRRLADHLKGVLVFVCFVFTKN